MSMSAVAAVEVAAENVWLVLMMKRRRRRMTTKKKALLAVLIAVFAMKVGKNVRSAVVVWWKLKRQCLLS